MRLFFTLPLLVLFVVAYPYGVNKTVITVNDYPEHLVIYEGKHDIIDIMVPLNRLNENDSNEHHSSDLSQGTKHHIMFFVEAEFIRGDYKNHGTYMYTNGKTTKIMDKGKVIAASFDDSEHVFLGAEDGLYIYNPEAPKAEKYGNFNKNIKDMAKEQYTDVIYVLTEDKKLYKVYDDATKHVEVDDVKDAEAIMVDYSNNLYYYGIDKKPYVRTADGETNKIEGLPEGTKDVKFLRPMLFNFGEIGLMVDNEVYTIFSDGTSQSENLEFSPEAKPTAYSMEAGIFHYFGYKKKIYEYELSLMEDFEYNDNESDFESASNEA